MRTVLLPPGSLGTAQKDHPIMTNGAAAMAAGNGYPFGSTTTVTSAVMPAKTLIATL